MPSESGGLEQIPAVAVEIFEHCDRTVVLVFWFPDEFNSHFEHSVVVPPEIVLIEPKQTLHTGTQHTGQTVAIEDQEWI